MNSNIDILNDLNKDIEKSLELIKNDNLDSQEELFETHNDDLSESDYLLLKDYLDERKEDSEKKNFFSIKNIKISFSFLTKYILTSFGIFVLLMLSSNYQAYLNIANSYIKKDEMVNTNNSLINSVKATSITNNKKEEIKKETKDDDKLNNSLKSFVNLKEEKPSLNIDITPYENRIIIPKIWKNIPLVDIKNRTVSWQSELNDIFMSELEKWVVRYPWSVKPWELWNSFIFWHSSNFPWINWEFNDVFSTLNNVSFNDEIIIYYNQKKYVYTIKKRDIISPWNVSIFKWNKTKAQVMIMTCWPIWTTLNRLVLTWELKKD